MTLRWPAQRLPRLTDFGRCGLSRAHSAFVRSPRSMNMPTTRVRSSHKICHGQNLATCVFSPRLRGPTEGGVQNSHELRSAALTTGRERVSLEDIDQGRCGSFVGLFDRPVPGPGILACVDFGDACRIRSGAQNVAHLVSLRDRVQVSGRCGIAGGLRSETCGFSGSLLRRSVSVHRRDALELGPGRTVDELPCRIDGRPRSGVTGVGILEHRENFLRSLGDVARYDSQFVHGQFEVTVHARHEGDRRTFRTGARLRAGPAPWSGRRAASLAPSVIRRTGPRRRQQHLPTAVLARTEGRPAPLRSGGGQPSVVPRHRSQRLRRSGRGAAAVTASASGCFSCGAVAAWRSGG